jgi:hypothetical protein
VLVYSRAGITVDRANEIFNKWLEDGQRVVLTAENYGHYDTWVYERDIDELDGLPTHSARLVMIRELE